MNIMWNLTLRPIEKKTLQLTLGVAFFSLLVGAVWLLNRDWFWLFQTYKTQIQDAYHLPIGTPVSFHGIPIGYVKDWYLNDDGQVTVEFRIHRKHRRWIRSSSYLRMIRPHLLAKREFELISPALNDPPLEGDTIPTRWQWDLMAWLTGRLKEEDLTLWSQAFSNLGFFLLQVTDQNRLDSAIKSFDNFTLMISEMNGLLKQVEELLKNLNEHKQLARLVTQTLHMLKSLESWSNQFNAHGGGNPDMYARIIKGLEITLSSWQQAAPQMVGVSHQLDEFIRQTLATLRELQILSRALQDTFWLRASAHKARELWWLEKENRQPACLKE